MNVISRHVVIVAISLLVRPAVWAAEGDGPGSSPGPLVRAVLENNRGITAMQAAVQAARARSDSAGALPDPMLSYTAAPRVVKPQRPGTVQLSQSIPWPGTLRLRTQAANAETESTRHQLEDLRLRLAAETRSAYAGWYYVHRAIAINQENRKLVARLQQVAEAAYGAGGASQQDVLQAQVELTRLVNQSLELERRRDQAQAGINRLLNRKPGDPLARPGELPAAPVLPAPAALQELALARHPALQSLHAQIAAADDRLALAEKSRMPNFTLMTGYNNLWDMPRKRFTVGVGINIPFGGNHRGEISEASASLRQSRAKLEDARTELLSELDQAYAGAQQARSTIALYTDDLLPLASQNLAAAEAGYRNGSGDFLALITAEQQDLMARLELARVRADLYTQLASLDYQTGGALLPAGEVSP